MLLEIIKLAQLQYKIVVTSFVEIIDRTENILEVKKRKKNKNKK